MASNQFPVVEVSCLVITNVCRGVFSNTTYRTRQKVCLANHVPNRSLRVPAHSGVSLNVQERHCVCQPRGDSSVLQPCYAYVVFISYLPKDPPMRDRSPIHLESCAKQRHDKEHPCCLWQLWYGVAVFRVSISERYVTGLEKRTR